MRSRRQIRSLLAVAKGGIEVHWGNRQRQSGHASVASLNDNPGVIVLKCDINRDERVFETRRDRPPFRQFIQGAIARDRRSMSEQFAAPEEETMFLVHRLSSDVVFQDNEVVIA